jgi:hypothetical protein
LNNKEVIIMGSRTFRIKEKMILQKTGITRMLRGIRSHIYGHSDVYSCPDTDENATRSFNASPREIQAAKQRMIEIETQEAFIIKTSRHESGKAGGPM